MEIIFTNIKEISDYFIPTPASQLIPEWYKKLESYAFQGKVPIALDSLNTTSATAKRCMPLFDSLTAGYILYTPVDVYVMQKNNAPYYSWAAGDMLGFHAVEQAGEHPAKNGFNYPKWNNPWSIKTPKGYSILITAPMHRESVFTILDAVVDSDTYLNSVNLPFTLNDTKYEGMIPAGTPMAQIIPFKREKWTMQIGGEKEIIEIKKSNLAIMSKFFDAYKTLFRQAKEYK
jgi:hypothetical protein